MKRVPDFELSPDSDCNDGVYYHSGEPFTGISFGDQGDRKYESEWRHGLPWGISRSWSRAGTLVSEGEFARGVHHGRNRKWHANGQLARDEMWELGICLQRTVWDEAGTVTDQFELEENTPNFRVLQTLREWEIRVNQAEGETGTDEAACT